MKAKFVLSTCALIILTGCGGTNDVSFTTLSVLSNGQGIARGITNTGEQALLYTSEVVEVVAGANNSANSSLGVTISDLPITSITGNTIIRTGTMTSGGYTFNVSAVEDSTVVNAEAIYMETPGYADLAMVAGAAYSSPPTTGSYAYSGTQTSNARSVKAPGSIGTFALSVDFSSDAFGYAGSSGIVNVSGSGVLDSANGRFATSSLSISAGGSSYGGTMHGMLHGNGAKDTSGVFHTDDYAPDYAGTFIGSR